MYLFSIDGMAYGPRNGLTLVEAMRQVRGCGNAKVHRMNGSVVVRGAGSTASPWVHVPTGRRINHRSTRWARERFHAEMAARNAARRAAYAL